MMFGMLLWPLLLIGLVWLVWQNSRQGEAGPQPSPPLRAGAREILDERYARGEIKREEYLSRRQDL